jgi:hypothetical protein
MKRELSIALFVRHIFLALPTLLKGIYWAFLANTNPHFIRDRELENSNQGIGHND